jgi:polyhydroxyalkanoate synthesis repressor PhaR
MLDQAPKSPPPTQPAPVVIKKYANRRLYNTETSTYVTLDDLAAMVRANRDFVVYDAKSGDDLTHAVLTQIIVEQESRGGGGTMLPIPFLQQLIRFYGGDMQKMVPSYLQVSLAHLAQEQERFAKQFAGSVTPQAALEAFQEQARKNVQLFEQAMHQAMSIFSPFGAASASSPSQAAAEAPAPAPRPSRPEIVRMEPDVSHKPPAQRGDEIAELKAQMAAMQAMIERLTERSGR